MYKLFIAIMVPQTRQHIILSIVFGALSALVYTGAVLASDLAAGVQTPLLTPGKSQLVQQLEALFYDDDFCVIPNRTFNTADFGAVGDGKTLNTEAIQKTIDAATAAGGGRVTFNPGIYVTGALFVKTNVDFHIPKGVTIQAIQDDAHFPDVLSRIAGVTME